LFSLIKFHSFVKLIFFVVQNLLDTIWKATCWLFQLLGSQIRSRTILVKHLLDKIWPIVLLFHWLSHFFFRVIIIKQFLVFLLVIKISILYVFALFTSTFFQWFEIVKSFLLITLIIHVILVHAVIVFLLWMLVTLSNRSLRQGIFAHTSSFTRTPGQERLGGFWWVGAWGTSWALWFILLLIHLTPLVKIRLLTAVNPLFNIWFLDCRRHHSSCLLVGSWAWPIHRDSCSWLWFVLLKIISVVSIGLFRLLLEWHWDLCALSFQEFSLRCCLWLRILFFNYDSSSCSFRHFFLQKFLKGFGLFYRNCNFINIKYLRDLSLDIRIFVSAY
jgi:hypothetical protein